MLLMLMLVKHAVRQFCCSECDGCMGMVWARHVLLPQTGMYSFQQKQLQIVPDDSSLAGAASRSHLKLALVYVLISSWTH
jgi:hypothetical protein